MRDKVARALMLHHDIDPDVFIGINGGHGHWLDAADAAIAVVIEECAKVAEGNDHFPQEGEAIARAIRALAD